MNLSPLEESGHFVLAKFIDEEKTTLLLMIVGEYAMMYVCMMYV